jgi:hypothetical protein
VKLLAYRAECSWITSIRAALSGEQEERDLLGQPLVAALLPDYLQALEGLEDKIADREAQIEAAQADDEEDAEG